MPNPWAPPPPTPPKGQHARFGRLPTGRPGQRRLVPLQQRGLTPEDPILIGEQNDAVARFVEATGAVGDVRKGERRWVTGGYVDRALEVGALVLLIEPV